MSDRRSQLIPYAGLLENFPGVPYLPHPKSLCRRLGQNRRDHRPIRIHLAMHIPDRSFAPDYPRTSNSHRAGHRRKLAVVALNKTYVKNSHSGRRLCRSAPRKSRRSPRGMLRCRMSRCHPAEWRYCPRCTQGRPRRAACPCVSSSCRCSSTEYRHRNVSGSRRRAGSCNQPRMPVKTK